MSWKKRPRTDNPKFHDLKVVPLSGNYARVYLDGREITGVRSIDYHICVDEMPTAVMEVYANKFEAFCEVEMENV